jgi:hypothetical protein
MKPTGPSWGKKPALPKALTASLKSKTAGMMTNKE